jgi:hypothetical protein
MPSPKASSGGVTKAKDSLQKKKTYIQFLASRQKDADIAALPVPMRGKQLGAEWALAKKELGIPVTVKKTKSKASNSKK